VANCSSALFAGTGKSETGYSSREEFDGLTITVSHFALAKTFNLQVNFNILSHPGYKASVAALLRIESAVVGRSFDFSDINDLETAGRRDVFELFLLRWKEDRFYGDDPVANLHWPIFDSFDEGTQEMVGLLNCVIYWRTYFEDILADHAIVDVVLVNTCDQSYTYQINGPDVTYLGAGDRHDPKFDRFLVATKSGVYLQGDTIERDTEGSCLYSIQVYPSEQYQEIYVTSKPAIFTAMLILVFLFTSAVFFMYDCLVERRQRVVMDTAVASSAIVSSLFPKNVRDRLYNKASDPDKADATAETPFATHSSRAGTGIETETNNGLDNMVTGYSKPIADLFHNCTVLFADIVGK
jgi:hypothetical protein